MCGGNRVERKTAPVVFQENRFFPPESKRLANEMGSQCADYSQSKTHRQ